MKRIKSIGGVELYDLICDRHNILQAVKAAARCNHDDQARRMKLDPGPYAEEAERILRSESFHYSKFISRDIVEHGKRRHICYTRTFPDGVIQHAVLQVVAPILFATCTADTYAARPGWGLHRCSMNLRRDVRRDPEGTKYYLKTDVRHYFDSVDRDVLWRLVKRKIKCRRTLDVLHELIFGQPGRRGLAIGLYFSQIAASFLLGGLCHRLKEDYGVRHLYLYMDDLVILSSDKAYLHRMRKVLADMLERDYHLTLKRNWCVRPLADGLDFVGFVHYPDGTRIRKRVKVGYIRSAQSIVRAHRHGGRVTDRMRASFEAREAMLRWADCRRLIHITRPRIDAIVAKQEATA